MDKFEKKSSIILMKIIEKATKSILKQLFIHFKLKGNKLKGAYRKLSLNKNCTLSSILTNIFYQLRLVFRYWIFIQIDIN